MLQHLGYTLVAPPLIIAGLPAWLVRLPLRDPATLRFMRLITMPLVAFAVFNAVQLLTHLPSAVDLALTHHWFHLGVHVALVGTALLMWWPILSPVEELPRLSYPLQMGYLFVQSLLPSVLAAFVTFADGVVYDYYASAPRLWDLTPVEDQQYAGFVMKVMGSLILWGFIAFAFFRWYDKENRREQDPRWEDVKAELERLGMPFEEPAPRLR
jgi:putative membrane protein